MQAAAEALLKRALERQREEAEARGNDPTQSQRFDGELSPNQPVPGVHSKGIVEQGALETVAGPGEFDARLVAQELKRRLRPMQLCYESLLRRDPSLRGSALVDFTLQSEGTMARVALAPDSGSEPRLEPCSAGVIKRFRFKPGPEGGSVSYRSALTFRPAEP